MVHATIIPALRELEPAQCLEDFLNSVENLPSEIQHILSEMVEKDNELQGIKHRLYEHHSELFRSEGSSSSVSTSSLSSEELAEQIDQEYLQAVQVTDEKFNIACKNIHLLELNIKRLEKELDFLSSSSTEWRDYLQTSTTGLLETEETTGTVGRSHMKRGSSSSSADDRPSKRQKFYDQENVPSTDEEDGFETAQPFETVEAAPDEEVFCICRQVSYGNMVACDNENCPIEWFHWDCVGLTKPPPDKWYCPMCVIANQVRGNDGISESEEQCNTHSSTDTSSPYLTTSPNRLTPELSTQSQLSTKTTQKVDHVTVTVPTPPRSRVSSLYVQEEPSVMSSYDIGAVPDLQSRKRRARAGH